MSTYLNYTQNDPIQQNHFFIVVDFMSAVSIVVTGSMVIVSELQKKWVKQWKNMYVPIVEEQKKRRNYIVSADSPTTIHSEYFINEQDYWQCLSCNFFTTSTLAIMVFLY